VKPGTPGLEHRIGGLEKHFTTGAVCYDAENHEKMVRIRAEKVARIADGYPATEVDGAPEGDVLVVGWGSTYGAITQALGELASRGRKVSGVHLRHLYPLPKDLGPILRRFKRVVVPEMNLGQLTQLLRAEYLVDARCISKVEGKPFKVAELIQRIEELYR
jgi:2-oxoglutarate ferredoxin oxidoreductase subunit alpha